MVFFQFVKNTRSTATGTHFQWMACSRLWDSLQVVEFQQVMDGNLLPSGMAAQALGQEPQAALPEDGAQPQEGGSASQQDQD